MIFNALRFTNDQNGRTGQVIKEARNLISGVVGILNLMEQNAELTRRREFDRCHLLQRNLGLGIKVSNGFYLVAKKLDPDRPGTGEWKRIDNPTPQGEISFLGDLGLRLIGLALQPLDEIKGITGIPDRNGPDPPGEFVRRKGFLQQGRRISDDDRTRLPLALI